jgi:hypothetical protein
VAFLASATLVFLTAIPGRAATEDRGRSVWRNITFGISAYLATPRLRGLLALSLAVAAAGAMVIVNSVVIVRTDLDLGAAAVGIAFGASGAGSMVVALLLPRLLGRIAERTLMLTAGAVLGAGLIAAAAVDRYETLLLVWFVLGAGASAIVACSVGVNAAEHACRKKISANTCQTSPMNGRQTTNPARPTSSAIRRARRGSRLANAPAIGAMVT